jgi:hypothetical protein
VLAADPRNLTALQRKVLLNADLLAINQDGPNPTTGTFHSARRVGFDVGCTATVGGASADGKHCEIWARRLSSGAVAVVRSAFSTEI